MSTQTNLSPPVNDFNPTGVRYLATYREWQACHIECECGQPHQWAVYRWDPPAGYTCVMLLDRYSGIPEPFARLAAWCMNQRSDGFEIAAVVTEMDILDHFYEGPWPADPWIRDDGSRIDTPAAI